MTLNNLQDLYIEQLEDLYNAEQQIIQAFPQLLNSASSPNLKNAFANHFQQTQTHVLRLETVFSALGIKPKSRVCKAMRGLIEECNEMIAEQSSPEVKDAGLIACTQRIEHYEIAAYGSARTFAETLGSLETARLLQATLNEEGEADKLLSLIATTVINQTAATVGSAR
jgi:ferritin-like metal-binding protein YciE